MKTLITYIMSTVAALAGMDATWTVDLAWDANPETNITSYVLYAREPATAFRQVQVVTNGTTTSVAGLQAGTTNIFAVTAVNSWGLESDRSNEVTVWLGQVKPSPPSGLREAARIVVTVFLP